MHQFLIYCIILFTGLFPALTQELSEGCISGDCQTGSGVYYYESYGKFIGQFVSGVREGHGTFIFNNGAVYVGNFSGGMFSGTGIMYYPDGGLYHGEFTEDVPDGQGTYTYPDGSTYKGGWKEGSFNGYGILTTSGGETQSGFFLNGEYMPKMEKETQTEPVPMDEDAFCRTIHQLVEMKETSFEIIKGRLLREEGELIVSRDYEVLLQLPGAVENTLTGIFGLSYYSDLGTYDMWEIQSEFDRYRTLISQCLPDYYHHLKNTGSLNQKLESGMLFPDGYSEHFIKLYMNETDDGITLGFLVFGGSHNRIRTIDYTGGSGDEVFDRNIRTILAAAPDKFSRVQGTKHESEDIFWGTTSWEVTAPLPNADCEIEFGILEPVSCRYEDAPDYESAVIQFNGLLEKLKRGLGNEYIYIMQPPSRDEPNGRAVFCHRDEEHAEDTAVVKLQMLELSSESYLIKISFDYSFFGLL